MVPRAWTLAFARMAEVAAPEHIPDSERESYGRGELPAPLHDPPEPTVDEDWARIAREFAEESVAAVKDLIFPLHGLDGRG